jgi:hypothetical protein
VLLPAFCTVFLGWPAAASLWAFQDEEMVAGAMGAFFLVFLLVGLGLYIYMALALQTIANKTNTQNAWLAWIPIANIILMLNVAQKPLWWILLMLLPLVNIIIMILVWMSIAKARQKPDWWGILMIVPFVNMIVPGYLAWAD